MNLQYPGFPHRDASRAASVFAGDLVIYREVSAIQPLLAFTKERLIAAFDGRDPPRAHQTLDPDEYGRRMGNLRAAWRHNDEVRRAWIDIFTDVGLDLNDACYDWFYVRALPPGEAHLGRHTPLLPPHRDTWGSNVYQQINWWAPIFPISSANTFVVYPDCWQRAVRNTSAEWNLEALRQLPPAQRRDYPRLPDILEIPEDAVPVVLEPGDILAFSAQHLHGSQFNATEAARFNLECRTVCVADVTSGRAAPNADGAASHVAWDWFKRLTDGTPLPDLLAARGVGATSPGPPHPNPLPP